MQPLVPSNRNFNDNDIGNNKIKKGICFSVLLDQTFSKMRNEEIVIFYLNSGEYTFSI